MSFKSHVYICACIAGFVGSWGILCADFYKLPAGALIYRSIRQVACAVIFELMPLLLLFFAESLLLHGLVLGLVQRKEFCIIGISELREDCIILVKKFYNQIMG